MGPSPSKAKWLPFSFFLILSTFLSSPKPNTKPLVHKAAHALRLTTGSRVSHLDGRPRASDRPTRLLPATKSGRHPETFFLEWFFKSAMRAKTLSEVRQECAFYWHSNSKGLVLCRRHKVKPFPWSAQLTMHSALDAKAMPEMASMQRFHLISSTTVPAWAKPP